MRTTRIEVDFADGTYSFCLRYGELAELQEKTGRGPENILQRLMAGEWTALEVRETIRIGLIGGGTKPEDALRLVRRYVDELEWMTAKNLARVILGACLLGTETEPWPGKDEPGKPEAPISPTDGSTSPGSTAPQP